MSDRDVMAASQPKDVEPLWRLIQRPRPADRCRPDSLCTAIGARSFIHTSPTRPVGSRLFGTQTRR
jgi:hypothetical protein